MKAGPTDRGRQLRVLIYGLYAVYAILDALTRELMVASLEATPSFQRIAEMWDDPSLSLLIDIPFWWEQFNSIGLYLLALPFLAVFGPVYLSIKLAGVVWSLLGLWCIDRSLGAGRTGLVAVALIAFGNAVATEVHLVPHGGFTQLLLPYGLLMLAVRRFGIRLPQMSRPEVVLFGALPPLIVPFLAGFSPGVLATVGALLVWMGLPMLRRDLPWLLGGALVGAFLLTVVLTTQDCLTGVPYLRTGMDAVWRILLLVAVDLADWLGIHGVRWTGYVTELAFLAPIIWGVARLRRDRDPVLAVLVAQAILVPLWVAVCAHQVAEVPGPLGDRFRHHTMFWPAWSALMAMFLTAGPEGLGRRFAPARRYAAAVCAALLVAGTITSFGSIDYCRMGITSRVQLASALGRIIDRDIPKCRRPGQDIDRLAVLESGKAKTLALAAGFDYVIDYHEAGASRVLSELPAVPPDLREPYLFGLGFFACDHSLPLSWEAEASLGELAKILDDSDAQLLEDGCRFSQRWREGEFALRTFEWPLDSFTETSRTCRAWGSPARFRSLPLGFRRLDHQAREPRALTVIDLQLDERFEGEVLGSPLVIGFDEVADGWPPDGSEPLFFWAGDPTRTWPHTVTVDYPVGSWVRIVLDRDGDGRPGPDDLVGEVLAPGALADTRKLTFVFKQTVRESRQRGTPP